MEKQVTLRTAVFEDALATLAKEILKNQEYPNVLQDKLQLALMLWAVAKMGGDWKRYLNEALAAFLVMGAQMMAMKGWDASRAIRGIPLMFPLNPGKWFSPFDELFGDKSILRAKDAYHGLLPKLTELKRKTRTSTAFRIGLKELLPGGDQKWIEVLYRSAEPSDIAATYVCKKYRLDMGPEALKKRLARVKDHKAIATWIDKAFAKACSTKGVSPSI